MKERPILFSGAVRIDPGRPGQGGEVSEDTEHELAEALRAVFISPDKMDSNFEPANVVDGLYVLGRALAKDQPTLRDRFAMAALTGYIGHGTYAGTDGPVIAKFAYQVADAMLAARAKADGGEG